METILVTGGAGFIGSNFIKYLLNTCPAARVVNVDKLTYAGNEGNLMDICPNENYIFVREDICNRKGIEEIFFRFRPDFVINFAAESHVDRSIRDSEAFVRTNVLGVQVLLQTSLECNVRRYVQISTDEVYGPAESGLYLSEEAGLMPSSPYAASKAAADLLVQSFYTTYKLPVIITRCSNNYGPNQYPEKFIPLIIKNCLDNIRIPIYGNGRNVRDWLHVLDHCAAIYRVLRDGREGDIYNISAGNEKENILIARLIIGILRDIPGCDDKRRSLINENLIEYVEDRKGHDKRYGISSDKLRNELGWEPVRHFDEAIVQTVRWYVDNACWFYATGKGCTA